MAANDSLWISSAYKVLTTMQKAMHVSEIEQHIKALNVTDRPSIPLEVLLTKEAAMGRKFTKPDGSLAGFFSLLPPQRTLEMKTEPESSVSPIHMSNQISTESATEINVSSNLKYQQKYNQLKKTCKQMIYLNAALYDEIARLEKKIDKTAQERRIILQKIMADQNIVNPKEQKDASQQLSAKTSECESEKAKSSDGAKRDGSSTSPPAKKFKGRGDEERTGESKEKVSTKSSKKSSSISTKIPPIELDPTGCPVLPIALSAGLTIYSLGEINDKTGYGVTSSIFPVGYCSTREYACFRNPTKKCLYTCKITEGSIGPKFEISPDTDQATVFVDDTPEGCHNKLMRLFRKATGQQLPITRKSDFFGLKHPVVKNLLQCSQGANNCIEYQWCKFEITKDKSKLTPVLSTVDPACGFKALSKLLHQTRDETRAEDAAADE